MSEPVGQAAEPLELVLFTTRREEIERALHAGIESIIVDWEWRGKVDRQRGADTEINRDTVEDLERLTEMGVPRRVCRINRFGPWTREEVMQAMDAGATLLMVPMVERAGDVEAVLTWVEQLTGCSKEPGGCRVGILVETEEGVANAPDLARLPLDRVYVGLNDLAISRGATSLFEAVADGTVAHLRAVFAGHRFGFGGVTVMDGGAPIPCRLLLAEMVRLGASFSFLRRSFKRDLEGRDAEGWAREVARIRSAWRELAARDREARNADHAALVAAVGELAGIAGANPGKARGA